jgi:hypothetical protein
MRQFSTLNLADAKDAASSYLDRGWYPVPRVERLRWIKARMRENPIIALLAETEDMRRDHYNDLELRVICSGDDTTIRGVFGSQTLTPTSTSETGGFTPR